jgi:hypothetical protein
MVIRAAFICLVWNGFVIVWFSNGLKAADEGGWLAVFFGTPHAVIGALLLYGTLALLLNRTIIKATSEFLTVRNGPVPWFGNRTLAVAELARLHCQQDDKKEGEASCSYSIHALEKGGRRVELVDKLGRDQALFIMQKLERRLEQT